jgi:lipid-A-disaccharide synthase
MSAAGRADSAPLIGMVAGEASGDFLGATLIAALKKRVPGARFAGIGGPKMQAQGFDSWHPMEHLAVRGYAEVLRHYLAITSMRRTLFRRLAAASPSVFIGIDAPDFNLALERWLKKRSVATVHYVSPSVWAWRGGRIRSIGRSAGRMLVLFPFEEQIYRDAGIAVNYVGHPLADVIPMQDQTAAAREQLQLPPAATVIALLPGSRQSELAYMAKTFIQTAKLIARQRPTTRFLVPMASRETRDMFETELYAEQAESLPITILFGHAREAIAAANVVLVASGTATLETGLFRKPMVITYKMASSSWKLMSRLRYQPWVGLPNIIAGRFVVPEFLQDEATPENLAQALLNELGDASVRRGLSQEFDSMHRLLRHNAAERAADAVMESLR